MSQRRTHMLYTRLLSYSWLGIAIALTSCSSFHKDWQATSLQKTENRSSIEGRWDGSWQSDTNNHSGKLRCIVSKADREDAYKFRYWGTFASIFRFDYTVEYDAQRTAKGWQMQGESDLGIMGGVFNHQATIRDGTFDATYSSKWDDGNFHLHRPQ